MGKCKLVRFPSDVNSKLLRLLDEEFEIVQGKIEGIQYKVAIASLIYAIVGTIADLAFAVSQCISKYGSHHIGGCKMHHEAFEGHIGLLIMSWRQVYCLEGIL